MRHEKYNISGMSCSACSARIEKSVAKLEGIKKINVNLLTNSMQVDYDETLLTSDKIIQTVIHTGYGASIANAKKASVEKQESSATAVSTKNETQQIKYRLITSLIFLIPIMYIAMHHMFFEWFGLPVPTWIAGIFHGPENALTFSFAQFLLVLPILYLNRKYFQNGFRNLFQGFPNMDSLVAIGAGASVVFGIFSIFRIGWGLGHENWNLVINYSSNLYFESAGMIITLITLGKFLESKSKGKTSEAIEKLINIVPKQATILKNNQEIIIPIDSLKVGDEVIVRPGESIPVDGIISTGNTSIDESAITGESIPVEKQIGDTVISATLNKNGSIHFIAQKVGADTTINQIIQLVDEASSSKAPIAKLADKISGIFVPVVITIAIIVTCIWLFMGSSIEFAFSIGIAILVISCPCALGLATPVAIMVGTGKGAENGILIKSGEALETAHTIDTVVIDKTGTITEGHPVVTNCLPINMDSKTLLAIAAGLEKNSEHPLAKAIIKYTDSQNIIPYIFDNFKASFGQGVQGIYNNNIYYAGNTSFMEKQGINSSFVSSKLNQLADEGKTPLLFACEKNIIGILAVADIEKPTSARAISLFKKMNISVVMLTGDNKRTAEALRKRLQIPQVIAEVLPQDKEKQIAILQSQGHKVAMIGDGINDAPALARANLGIAIGAGTDIAIDSADAVLMRNDLLDAVTTVRLSKAVIKNIKENLFWAFFYNIIGIPLAAGLLYPTFGIKLSPMIGAAAMSMSSVCVVLNALRLRFFKTDHINQNVSRETFFQIQKKEEDSMMKTTLKIKGMMCTHCQKHVQEALQAIDGVVTVTVDLERNKAEVVSTREITTAEFEKSITDAGYELVQ